MRAGQVVQKELNEIGSVPTGTAVITGAGKMKVSHIIHVNGPKFHEPDTEEKLKKTICAALAIADEKGITQIAFPPIGTGFYQVPQDQNATVMVNTIETYLKGETGLKEVLLVALDTREFKPLQAKLEGGA